MAPLVITIIIMLVGQEVVVIGSDHQIKLPYPDPDSLLLPQLLILVLPDPKEGVTVQIQFT